MFILEIKKIRIEHVVILIGLLLSCEPKKPEPPDYSSQITITTNIPSDIGYYTATISGILGDTKGREVSDYGHCWNTSENPVTSNNSSKFGKASSQKNFISNLDNLLPGTEYYVRAYFRIDGVNWYSNQISFTTDTTGLPTIQTVDVTNIGSDTATTGGIVTGDGGTTIKVKGVCWNTTGDPTIDDDTTNNGTEMGTFISYLTGLQPNTTYYVRAYATNSEGTGYGSQKDFTTKSGIIQITTNQVTNILSTSAICGGKILDDGGLPIIIKGVCWNTSGTPTIEDDTTNNGNGTEEYISNIYELETNTTYYVRAYALNSLNITYGEELSFMTFYGNVTDYDGNVYNTVQIGNQIWMAKNLATTHYSDGTPLVDGTSVGDIIDDSTTKYWFVYNNNIVYKENYGLLYSWAAVMNEDHSSNTNPSGVQGVCPSSWHVPSIVEWQQLFNFLGGDSVAGGKLKEIGNSYWNKPNIDASNETRYTAVGSGQRLSSGVYSGLGITSNIWSSVGYNSTGYFIIIFQSSADAYIWSTNVEYGLTVRCIKDDNE